MILTPKQLKDIFFHRSDVFSVQQSTGAYFPTRRPIEISDIEQHIAGEKTIGAYCLKTDNTVKWACVDLDGSEDPAELRRLRRVADKIYDYFNPYPRMLEFSGRKGYHVWIFFKKPIQAKFAQQFVKSGLNRIGIGGVEIFPKQTELNEHRKYGNLVKIPMAIHRVSGKKSKILKMEGIQ